MEFMLGCNYWASHAGTDMWRDWDETVVRADLKRITEHGMKYLRVFPNWRDFQPAKAMYAGCGTFREYVNANDELFDNPYYLDYSMVERFKRFCEIAEEYDCKLIVGLVTGWMSGRLFIPPALAGKNIFADPTALVFQEKYLRGMVRALKDCKAICAWDLGNECNCMAVADDRDTAIAWTALISNTIRANDPDRMIVSGMHSLTLDGQWTIADQSEYTDILTTHPYPLWVSHCREDRISSLRTLLHATAESVYYSSIQGKPCLVEEIGTMGPMICDDETAAGFLRVNLFSNWANGQQGVLWWCANEQTMLDSAPYRWNMCERELGIFDENHNPKPIANEMRMFSEFLNTLPYTLPARKTDGVCILSQSQDHWAIAYMTYILAKQAGIEITFCDASAQIPEAPYYLLPSIAGQVMDKKQYDLFKKRVYDGARLYISNDFGFLTEFAKLTGMKIKDSENTDVCYTMNLEGNSLGFQYGRKCILETQGAEVFATDHENNPCFTGYQYGKGEVYYLNFPLEKMILNRKDWFEDEYYRIYKKVFQQSLSEKKILTNNPHIAVTEHILGDETVGVIVNYSNCVQKVELVLNNCTISTIDYGDAEVLQPFSACVLRVKNSKKHNEK